jgi:YD repeat-containing protein
MARGIVLVVGLLTAGAAAATAADHTDLYGDPLPPGALARIGSARFRHPDAVVSVVYAPDGKSVATCGRDGSVRIWDLATGKARQRFGLWATEPTPIAESPAGQKTLTIAYSPDGKRLATPGWKNVIVIRDAVTRGELMRLEGHERAVAAVAFGPDGKTLVSMDVGETVRVWDAEAGKVKLTIPGRKTRVIAFALSPDGKTIATGAELGVRLWDTAGRLVGEIERTGWVHSLAFSPDGKTLAVGNRGGAVQLCDVATAQKGVLLRARTESHADSLAFSPDGKSLAMGSDGTVVVWDLATGKATVLDMGPTDTSQTAVTFSPDGKTLAVASEEKAPRFCDTDTLRERPGAAGHTSPVLALAFSPDGKTLATGAHDRSVRFWDAATGKETTGKRGQTVHVNCLAFSPDGRRLLAAASLSGLWADPSVWMWDADTGENLFHFRGHNSAIWRVLFAADGKTFVTGGSDGDVAVWDSGTGKEVRRFKRVAGAVFDVSLSPDGQALAAGGYDNVPGQGEHTEGVVRLLDFATGRARPALWAHEQAVLCVAFSRDGRALASSGYQEPVLLWELATGRPRWRALGGRDYARRLAVSPDGRRLVLGCSDGTVRVCDLLTGKERHRFDGRGGVIGALAFSPDGRVLASAGDDSTVLLWDMSAVPPAPPARAPDAAALERLWADLADDPQTAYAAVGRLATAPKEAVPFLAERVRPVAAPEAKTLRRLLADLDSDSFEERERATAELRRLGELAGPALRELLRGSPTAEARKRAGEILADLDRDLPPRDQLRDLRAVESLEWAGAADVLRQLAAGAPEARLTREAKVALGRLTATRR